MRNHVVGIGLLVILAAAIWGTARLAAPSLGEAFETESADEAAGTAEDVVDLTVGDAPLSSDEIINLQWYLTLEGQDTGGIDGLLGAMTVAAIEATIVAHELDPATTDRALLDYLTTFYNGPAVEGPALDDTDVETPEPENPDLVAPGPEIEVEAP